MECMLREINGHRALCAHHYMLLTLGRGQMHGKLQRETPYYKAEVGPAKRAQKAQKENFAFAKPLTAHLAAPCS